MSTRAAPTFSVPAPAGSSVAMIEAPAVKATTSTRTQRRVIALSPTGHAYRRAKSAAREAVSITRIPA